MPTLLVGTSILLITPTPASAQRRDRVTVPAARQGGDGFDAPLVPSGTSAFGNALRLARMLRDERLVAGLLAMQGMSKTATEADLRSVVEANEAAGLTSVAIAFLRDRVQRFPNEARTRVLLARLLARSGQSSAAVDVWEELIARFGFEALTLDEAHAYARDASRANDVDRAWTVLVRLASKMPPSAKEYWLDLATLAWDRDEGPTALLAYETLYRLDPKTPHAGARLMSLLVEVNRHDDAVRIAMEEHRRTGDPGAVLFAGHLRAEQGNWLAVKGIVDQAEQSPGALHGRAEYFLLKGDCAKHLGDLTGAWNAYRSALALSPDDATARANVLSTALERGDEVHTRLCVAAWRDSARAAPPLWAPMGQALEKLGRHAEAAMFFSLQLRASARDARTLLDLSGALSSLGRRGLGEALRRRAVHGLAKETAAAIQSTRRSHDDLQLIEAAALTTRSESGPPEAEKWFSVLFGSRVAGSAARTHADYSELAADWYLSTGRPDYARAVLRSRPPRELPRQRLALALVDGDHTQLRHLLERSAELAPEDRAHALLTLERDRDALGIISDTLAREPNGRDEAVLRDELARIGPLHRPQVRVGGTYVHVTGLDAVGPALAATHDAFAGRLTYAASGVRMTDRSGILTLTDERYEAEGGALLRLSNARGVTDISAALNYQVGTPIARFGFFDQRLLTSQLGLTTEVRAGQAIVDTSFLRLVGARNSASLGLRYDRARWYASADVEGREDQTRRYQHVAWELLGSAEAGLKVLTREPYVSVGAQAQISRREYRTHLPDDTLTLVSPRVDPARALPPSFELVGGVVHISRGDVSERYRPDRQSFPRYDCEAAFGVLFPTPDTALHVLCAASIRAPGGYTSVLAFYNRGIAGVRNNENAELAVSYTLPF